MAGSLPAFAIRGVQSIVAIIILGLSIDLIMGHKWGALPATLGFTIFVSAVVVLGALIGIASIWVEKIQGKIGMIVDGVVLILSLAGSVFILVKLKGVNCSNSDASYRYSSLRPIDMLNGGCKKVEKDEGKRCYYYTIGNEGGLNARCQKSQADAAFMIITVVVLLVSILLTFLRMKKGI